MEKVALVSPNSFAFEIRNKLGVAELKYKVIAGKPFLFPRNIAELYMRTDANFMLYTGKEVPEDVPFIPIAAYVPPPPFIQPAEEKKEVATYSDTVPVEVQIFLKDLLAENPKVHIDMIIPGAGGDTDTPSILTDPNITIENIKLVAQRLEVPYKENIDREKLIDRIIQVATARVNL